MKKVIKFFFLSRHGEIRSGWGVTVAIAFMLIGQMFGIGFSEACGEENLIMKLLGTGIYGFITLVGGIFLYKVMYRQALQKVGVTSNRCVLYLLYGTVLGTLAMSIIFVVLVLSGQSDIMGIAMGKIKILTILVELGSLSLTAFSEEFILRGFIMNAMKTTRNRIAIFSSSALIFSLLHLLNPGVTILSFLNILLAGFLFSYMLIKSGSLWLPTGFHIAWNFMQGDVLGMNVSGKEQASLVIMNMKGNNLFTGGRFGPEGGILVTIMLCAVFFLIHITVKNRNKIGFTMDNEEIDSK